MLRRAFAAEIPAGWVTGDEVYGDATDLRRWLEEERRPYVLAVSCSHPLWQHGRQERADALVAGLAPESWGTLSCGAGSQGERLYDWACLELPYDTVPGMRQWLLARRSRSDPAELAYFRAFGPEGTALATLVRVAGMRWAIEESFEDAKGSVGLDEYEVRKWRAWYRHITLALLAHAYLEVTRSTVEAGKKGDLQTTSSP
jgi:SRSO17 transposase